MRSVPRCLLRSNGFSRACIGKIYCGPSARQNEAFMNTQEFRRHAHALVDWMADYLETVERYPVRAQVKPGDIARQLPLSPPDRGEPMEQIFADFKSIVVP